MKRARSTTWKRTPAGASASGRLQRWPARNYFAALEPRSRDGHPVDDLMCRDPGLQRLRQRAVLALKRLQARPDADAVLDFEAERNHLDSARVEAAYNIGFEGGLVAGRSEALSRAGRRASNREERVLLQDLRAALAGTTAPSNTVEALLIELAWAFAVGGGPPGGAEAITPRRRS